MKKLFESKKVQASGTAIVAPDAKIIFTKVPFIQYEQILLDKNFTQYLETIVLSKKILRMGTQKTPIQKTYKINVGHDSLDIDTLGANSHFDWTELSSVYDKSNKHTTIYDIYNIKTLTLTTPAISLMTKDLVQIKVCTYFNTGDTKTLVKLQEK